MQHVLTPTPVIKLLPHPEQPLFLTTESNPGLLFRFSSSATSSKKPSLASRPPWPPLPL